MTNFQGRRSAVLMTCWLTAMIPLTPAAAVSILGSAANFAVLGGSAVTNAGDTAIIGDLGVAPNTSITGLGTTALTGAIHAGDTAAALAHSELAIAALYLASLPVSTELSGQDLGTIGTLTPGVYRFASSAQLTGMLTLDFAGHPNSPFIFQIGSTLITAAGSDVLVLNGGPRSAVFWDVGSSATFGTDSNFAGNIIAKVAATLNARAKVVCGRVMSQDAAVTLDRNTVSNNCRRGNHNGRDDFGSNGFVGDAVPEPSGWAMLLLGFGGVGITMRRREQAHVRCSRIPQSA